MSPRLMIIGEASRRGPPLSGTGGRKLARLAGVPLAELRADAILVNVLARWPGKAGKGDAWPTATARRRADRTAIPRGVRRVVLLGFRVARAFRVPATSCYYFARHRRGRAWWCVFPHPSGVNRWWNDPDNTRRAERYLRRLWEEAHQ